MDTTNDRARARKTHEPKGVPMVRTSFIDEPPPEALKNTGAWWAWLRVSALAAVLATTGCSVSCTGCMASE